MLSEQRKILIVDDIETNRSLLRQVLNSLYDYDIVEAFSGEHAIELFDQENPDLILMDIMMPGIDGRQATTLIKEKMGDVHTPIIFLTALNSDDSLTEALASGGDDFIAKPFNVEILQSKINAHLRIRDLTKQLNTKNSMLTRFNQRLIHEQELVEHFFESTMQQSFLDESIIKYHMSSLAVFNGDIFLAQRSPGGSLYVIVGDFTGHGLTAAIGTLPVSMIFFSMVGKGLSVGSIAREINKHLFKILPHSMFFVASIVEINPSGELMTTWTSGMPDSYIFNADGELSNVIHAQHLPLGIEDDDKFDSLVQVFRIEKSGKVYLCSDGVVEARNAEGKLFGEDQFKDILINGGSNRFNKVLEELNLFINTDQPTDDITFVELNCQKLPDIHQNDNQEMVDALEWRLSVRLSTSDMRKSNPLRQLFDILNTLPFLNQYRDILYVLLSEIYNNAVDHSILNLDSRVKSDSKDISDYYMARNEKLNELESAFIDFNFSFLEQDNNHFLKIEVEDSGSGYQEKQPQRTEHDFSGRGLDIIHHFCQEMSFSNDGKVFTALYRL